MVALMPACSMQTGSMLAAGPSSFEVAVDEPLVYQRSKEPKIAFYSASEDSQTLGHHFNQPACPQLVVTKFLKSRDQSNQANAHQPLLEKGKLSLLQKLARKGSTHMLALTSAVLGILAVVPPFSYFFLPAMAALTLGAFALRKIKRAPWGYSGKWMAIIGIMGGLLGSLFMLYQIAIAAFTIGTLSLTIFAIPLIVNMIVAAWLLLSA